MTRTLLMSVRLGTLALLHYFREAVEQVADVVRTRARLRMPLEAEGRPVGPRQALETAVEERDVRRPQVLWKAAGIDGEAVVLAGDGDGAAVEILHRMIGAVMAELHLYG